MAAQLHHEANRFVKKKFPVTLVCDRVNSPANIGSLFRIADSFGVEQIYFCGEDITVISKRMQRTARSTHHTIPYQQKDNLMDTLSFLKNEGYTLLALEITDTSIPVEKYMPVDQEKIALIIGEENFGVSTNALAIAKESLHINMFGTNSSMNVATATGIALYEITKRLDQHTN